ncbi:ACT domain-containing protein [Bacteroidetes bacterium endosymbiont of Geopemphigus sp.]|uniref:ACT domain-containing protein n=1 Tax=Bacteroidetes bacterium endosymbiont of Geopemphigus sp. TaxID=2047937 RepID=UPI000CD015C1|nr:ACT domain-containing protein [Bacteroidetes bacterium endosymbiont of Geopemphigus sp.]
MKNKFKIVILASNFARIIIRILIILNRRNINILYLNVVPLEDSQTMRCTLEVENSEESMHKVIKQIEKQIGVISTLYQESDKEKFIPVIKQEKSSMPSGYIQN